MAGFRSQVFEAARVVFSTGDIKVEAHRLSGRCGQYETTCSVAGRVVATSQHREWRKSYKMLKTRVEMLFDSSTVQTLSR